MPLWHTTSQYIPDDGWGHRCAAVQQLGSPWRLQCGKSAEIKAGPCRTFGPWRRHPCTTIDHVRGRFWPLQCSSFRVDPASPQRNVGQVGFGRPPLFPVARVHSPAGLGFYAIRGDVGGSTRHGVSGGRSIAWHSPHQCHGPLAVP